MNKLLILGLLIFAPITLAHADLKIAVVDLSKAFDGYYKTKDAQHLLKDKEDSYQKEIQDLITDYQRMGEEAQKLSDQSKDLTLSQAARDDKAKALEAKNKDLQNMGAKIQEMRTEKTREIQDEIMRRHQEILGEISKVISDYSGPQGYDLVLDKSSASGATGISIVLYNSSKLIDITADIVKLLNATAPAGTETSPGATPAPAPAAH